MKQILRAMIPMLLLGQSLLTAQAPLPSAPVTLSGKLEAVGGSFRLTDEKTHATVELRGSDLARYAGKKVSLTGEVISGASLPPGVSQVIQVDKIGAASNKGAAAAATTGTGAKVGVSTAVLTGVVATGGVAGTVGGLYASGAIGSDQPASRP